MTWNFQKTGGKDEVIQAVKDAVNGEIAEPISLLIQAMPDRTLVVESTGAIYPQNDMHDPDSDHINVNISIKK